MKKNLCLLFCGIFILAISGACYGQLQVITTIAGNGSIAPGYSGDGGPSTAALLNNPASVCTDASGNIYIADYANHVVRKINTTGIITTFAGTGAAGYSGDNGPATAALLTGPAGLAVDTSGNVFIADANNSVIRKVNTSGIISTFAGTGSGGYFGDLGPATAAMINFAYGVATDRAGNVYIADYGNSVIRKVDAGGTITTFAGIPLLPGYSGDGLPAIVALLNSPTDVIADGAGNVFIADYGNHVVRKVNTLGIITTYAGNGTAGYSGNDGPATAAELSNPYGIAADSAGNVYVADQNNNVIREINTAGIITTLAGTHSFGYSGDGGLATNANLAGPTDVATGPAGHTYIADFYSNTVRMLTPDNPPVFINGLTQTLITCQDAGVINITAQSAITDADSGQTETWSVGLAPANGTLGGFNTTMISNGDTVTPAGLTYTPNAGFSGVDSFKIMASDGVAITTATIMVTVNPTPIVFDPANQAVCNGNATTAVIFTGTVAGTSYSWANTDTSIGLAANGAGNISSFTATDTGNVASAATITVTPSANGCTGMGQSFTITVEPTPTVIDPPNQVLCNGDHSDTVFFSGTVSGTIYNWTNSDTSIGLAGTSSGNIPSFVVTNVSNIPAVAAITVTPLANGCAGMAQTLMITVNPTPNVSAPASQVICSGDSAAAVNFTGTVPGTIYNWTNTDSSIGLADTGIGNIPAFMVTDTANAPITATIVVTPSASGCTGIAQGFTVTVKPMPTVIDPPNQVLCNGDHSDTVFFSGTVSGTIYNWINSDTSIGLTGTGSGNIPSFVVTNVSNIPAVAAITVTPSANGCTGMAQTLTIAVNPTPNVSVPASQAICNGDSSAIVTFTGTVPGTVYNWTNTDSSIGLADTGVGNIPAFMVTDTANAPITGTIAVTPSANGCTGIAQTFMITVNPTPMLSSTISPTSICDSTLFSYVPVSATLGTTFTWGRDSVTGINNPMAAGADSINELLVNTTPNPISVTYVDTLRANGCMNTESITFAVNPRPMLNSTLTPAPICDSTLFSYAPSSATAGTTFNWSRGFIVGISNPMASGTDSINDTLVNVTPNPISVAYTYLLMANGCSNTELVAEVVNPRPMLSGTITPAAVCDSTLFSYVPASGTAGTTFTWDRNSTPGISNPMASGAGPINETLINTTDSEVTVTYIDTLTANGCMNTQNITLTVNPRPMLTSTLTPPAICDSSLFTYVATSGTTGTAFSWSRAFIDGISDSSSTGTDTINEYLNNITVDSVAVVYVYTLTAFSCSNIENVTVTVNPTPVLDPLLTPAICDSSMFIYATSSLTPGTTFSWSRAAVPGVSNPAASDTGKIDEVLINITTNPVAVVYVDTLTANGCSNIEDITVTINPKPLLTSTLSPAAICDSTLFSYLPASATTGTTFTWERPFMTGIGDTATTGADSIHEILDNITVNPVTVTYSVTATANGCSNTENVLVTVNPKPTLTSPLTAPSICNANEFIYGPSSFTTGTTYTWTRAEVAGITPPTSSGADSIMEVLTNSTSNPVTVIYAYTLTANGCSFMQNVLLTVNPYPPAPAITTAPPSSVCNDVYFQNFGAATQPPAGVAYSWSADNASISDTGVTNQYILVNFKSTGQAVVMLTATSLGTGCSSTVTDTISVGDTVADVPAEVIYFNNSFICLQNNETAYQWGYDNDSTLAPTVLQGEINQDYVNSTPDITHNNYWVKVADNGCVQKMYYNKPANAVMRAAMTEVSVYPNPAQDNLTVEINTTVTGNIQAELLNTLGQRIYSVQVNNNIAQMNVAGLPAGLYLINCYRDGIKISTTRIIKN